jgi:hypothetical protein
METNKIEKYKTLIGAIVSLICEDNKQNQPCIMSYLSLAIVDFNRLKLRNKEFENFDPNLLDVNGIKALYELSSNANKEEKKALEELRKVLPAAWDKSSSICNGYGFKKNFSSSFMFNQPTIERMSFYFKATDKFFFNDKEVIKKGILEVIKKEYDLSAKEKNELKNLANSDFYKFLSCLLIEAILTYELFKDRVAQDGVLSKFKLKLHSKNPLKDKTHETPNEEPPAPSPEPGDDPITDDPDDENQKKNSDDKSEEIEQLQKSAEISVGDDIKDGKKKDADEDGSIDIRESPSPIDDTDNDSNHGKGENRKKKDILLKIIKDKLSALIGPFPKKQTKKAHLPRTVLKCIVFALFFVSVLVLIPYNFSYINKFNEAKQTATQIIENNAYNAQEAAEAEKLFWAAIEHKIFSKFFNKNSEESYYYLMKLAVYEYEFSPDDSAEKMEKLINANRGNPEIQKNLRYIRLEAYYNKAVILYKSYEEENKDNLTKVLSTALIDISKLYNGGFEEKGIYAALSELYKIAWELELDVLSGNSERDDIIEILQGALSALYEEGYKNYDENFYLLWSGLYLIAYNYNNAPVPDDKVIKVISIVDSGLEHLPANLRLMMKKADVLWNAGKSAEADNIIEDIKIIFDELSDDEKSGLQEDYKNFLNGKGIIIVDFE